jgi:hypothetical protein
MPPNQRAGLGFLKDTILDQPACRTGRDLLDSWIFRIAGATGGSFCSRAAASGNADSPKRRKSGRQEHSGDGQDNRKGRPYDSPRAEFPIRHAVSVLRFFLYPANP